MSDEPWKFFSNTGYSHVYHWLTHWGRVTHICVSELTIIGSDNGFLTGRLSHYHDYLKQCWIIANYTNPGYSLSLVDTLLNAGSYRQPLEQEGNPMT